MRTARPDSLIPRRSLVCACRLVIVIAGVTLCFAPPAEALTLQQMVARERAVYSMPIEKRPNRFGHIYGNNVRRRHYGRVMVNQGRYKQPVRRFFYMM